MGKFKVGDEVRIKHGTKIDEKNKFNYKDIYIVTCINDHNYWPISINNENGGYEPFEEDELYKVEEKKTT